MSTLFDTVSATSSAIATGAALWAAIAASRSARATRDVAEAGLVASLLGEYYQPEMAKALRLLRQFKEDHPGDFAASWMRGMEANDPNARAVDHARRHVKSYFAKISAISECNLASKSPILFLTKVAGVEIYYDVVDPLELALNPLRDPRILNNLKKHVGSYYPGKTVRPIRP